jgi:Ran GTPase-activating protein (RanGAP) involved in mRNA processing and transport
LKNSGLGIQGFDESIQSVDLNQRIIAKLESMKSNQIISMPDSFLGDEGCRVMVDFFRHNSHNHIFKLDLKGNNIGERGASFLAQLMQENDSIKKLSLEWNSIGLSETGLATLCASLYHNTSLLELDLRNNQISQQGASTIADLIRSNKTLKKIDLKWNEIGKQGATLIF